MNSQLFQDKDSSSKRKIISFAYLAQATRDENDLLAGIVSIFKPIAKQVEGKVFDATEFCSFVDELYGLKIHPWAVQDLIGRLVSHGVLVEHKVIEGVKQYIYAEIEDEFTAITQSDIEDVVNKFVDFSLSKTEKLGITLEKETLCDSFLSHLTDLNFIAATLRPEEYAEKKHDANTLTTNKDKANWKKDVQEESRLNSLCAGFVLDAFNKNKELYELILKIVSGAIVSEVVLNFQEPAKEASMGKVKIILDTPFLMALLNLTSEKEYEFAKEQCEQIAAREATLAVYEHSVEELKDNLYAVLQSYDSGSAFGATGRRLREKPFNQYLRQILKDPESALKTRNIIILKNLTAESSYRVFSKDLEDELYSAFGYYNNSKAQERDALSIALTMRYRNGIKVKLKEFYNCHHIFLTENSFIPDKSRDFMIKKGVLSEGCVPPAVSGRYLSGLFWVLFGAKGKDLSRQLLLANCAAALEPSNELVKKMHQFLSKTDPVQAEMFESLMGDERAGQYLMQSSLGDASLLTNDNAVEVLQELQKSLTEKIEVEADKKIQKIEQQKEEELNDAKNSYQGEVDKLEEKQVSLTQQVEEYKEQVESQHSQLNELTKKIRRDEERLLTEFKRKIETIMKDATKAQKYFKWRLAFYTLIIGLMCNLLAINVEDPTAKVLIATLITLVSFSGFWFVPELIFSSLLVSYRDRYFSKLLKLRDIHIDDEKYSLDWVNQTLNSKKAADN